MRHLPWRALVTSASMMLILTGCDSFSHRLQADKPELAEDVRTACDNPAALTARNGSRAEQVNAQARLGAALQTCEARRAAAVQGFDGLAALR